MAAVPTESEDRITQVSEKERKDTDHDRKAWLDLLKIVLFLVGVFALVALLASLAPESADTIDFPYWGMP